MTPLLMAAWKTNSLYVVGSNCVPCQYALPRGGGGGGSHIKVTGVVIVLTFRG